MKKQKRCIGTLPDGTRCDDTARSRGMCNRCYTRWWRGHEMPGVEPRDRPRCCIHWCHDHVEAKDLCYRHWQRAYRDNLRINRIMKAVGIMIAEGRTPHVVVSEKDTEFAQLLAIRLTREHPDAEVNVYSADNPAGVFDYLDALDWGMLYELAVKGSDVTSDKPF